MRTHLVGCRSKRVLHRGSSLRYSCSENLIETRRVTCWRWRAHSTNFSTADAHCSGLPELPLHVQHTQLLLREPPCLRLTCSIRLCLPFLQHSPAHRLHCGCPGATGLHLFLCAAAAHRTCATSFPIWSPRRICPQDKHAYIKTAWAGEQVSELRTRESPAVPRRCRSARPGTRGDER
jgi:hypothetical protein